LFLTEEKVDDTGTHKQAPENLCACWLFKAWCQNPRKNLKLNIKSELQL